jgi:hypothetical protein
MVPALPRPPLEGRVAALWLVGPPLVYGVLAVVLFSAAWFAARPSWIGLGTDPANWQWFMEWARFAPAHRLNPLFTDYLNYPGGVNLMWNSATPLPALMLAPLTSTLGTVVAYNTLATAALALSATAAYAAIRSVVPSAPGSFLGGLLYGFGPYMITQSAGHPNLTLAFFPPLALILLDRALVRPRRPYWAALALGTWGAAQLLVGEEVLATTALVALLGLLLLWALHPAAGWARLRAGILPLLLALAAGLLLGAVPLYFQLAGPARVAGVLQPPDTYVNDLLGFIEPGRFQYITSLATQAVVGNFTGNFVEKVGYLGLPLAVLALVVAGVNWRRAEVRFFFLLALLCAWLSLGPVLHVGGVRVPGVPMPWALVQRLPLMENALPARLILQASLALAVLVAAAVENAVRGGGRARALWILGVVAALEALLPGLPFPATPAPRVAFFEPGGAAARIPEGSVALVTPMTEASTAMYFQAHSGMRFRMPEGHLYIPGPYNGSPPSALGGQLAFLETGTPRLDQSPRIRRRLLDDLERWRVRTVVVTPSRYQQGILALMEFVIGRPPELSDGAWVWWDVRPAELGYPAGPPG